eukprot:14504-Pelagomonas_calceolata.AAC.3
MLAQKQITRLIPQRSLPASFKFPCQPQHIPIDQALLERTFAVPRACRNHPCIAIMFRRLRLIPGVGKS